MTFTPGQTLLFTPTGLGLKQGIVILLRPLGPDEADAEVGPMYEVKYVDGDNAHAFEEELRVPRTAFYIDETMWSPMGYIPSLVTEGEAGHTPLSGDPEKGQAPWYWGTSLEVAKFVCRQANRDKGLSAKDVSDIILSSMKAGEVAR